MPPSPLPGPLRPAPAFPFAGRSRELGALGTMLPRLDGEGRRATLLSGEPGSGKSRLVRELAHALAAEGALVLYGACDAVVRAPFAPFVEALDHLVRSTDAARLRADAGVFGGELRRLLPGLPALIGDLPAPLEADADTERHRLHTAVAQLFRATSLHAPVLLVL